MLRVQANNELLIVRKEMGEKGTVLGDAVPSTQVQ
jgi:hypothetical protein